MLGALWPASLSEVRTPSRVPESPAGRSVRVDRLARPKSPRLDTLVVKTSKSAIPESTLLQGRDGARAGRQWPLVTPTSTAAGGSVSIVELDARSEISELPGVRAERAYIVLEGALSLRGQDASPVVAGMVAYIPEGIAAGAAVGEEGATLLAISVTASSRTSRSSAADGVCAFMIDSVEDQVVHDPARGFFDLRTRWLVNDEQCRSARLAIGLSTFSANARHELHRHHRVEEFFFVIEGEGAHLTESGGVQLKRVTSSTSRPTSGMGSRTGPSIGLAASSATSGRTTSRQAVTSLVRQSPRRLAGRPVRRPARDPARRT